MIDPRSKNPPFPRFMKFVCQDHDGHTQVEAYYRDNLGLKSGDDVLVLGEIANMPGHYVVVNRQGVIVPAIHPDMLTDLSEEEV